MRIVAEDVRKTELDAELCTRIRASILLAGPLVARWGEAVVPPPGGDVIGRRRLDTHIHALARLGAEITAERRLHLKAKGLVGAQVFLDEASVTGTENAVMAAALAEGETTIVNAACEPHVQDLCRFLVALGARIDGIGSNVLTIHGVDRLSGGEWRICPDHIEVASFVGLGAVTEGEIVIEDVVPEHMVGVWHGLRAPRRWTWHAEGSSVHVPGGQELVIQDDLGAQIPKIEDGPWPAFPADLTSIALAVATQARGTVLIFEKMFENRLFFVDKLVTMGAQDHPLRPAPRGRQRADAALRRADGEPRHPRRHGHADRRPLRGGALDDREHRPDRPRLRTHRRAPALARRKHRKGGWMSDKRAVRTESAPAPFQGAPYSQGIVAGDLVFVSGQLGIDPAQGHVVEGGIVEQTEQVMKNLSAILAGGRLQPRRRRHDLDLPGRPAGLPGDERGVRTPPQGAVPGARDHRDRCAAVGGTHRGRGHRPQGRVSRGRAVLLGLAVAC